MAPLAAASMAMFMSPGQVDSMSDSGPSSFAWNEVRVEGLAGVGDEGEERGWHGDRNTVNGAPQRPSPRWPMACP
jgi:hypothetical protein